MPTARRRAEGGRKIEAAPGGVPAGVRAARVPTSGAGDRRIRVVVLVAVLLGIGLRLWFVFSPIGPFDSDEAVAGLIGRHLLEGELRVFYWGQAYGGTHEAAMLAVLFALGAGPRLAMELVPIALSAAAAVLVWRIGLRTIGHRGALIAGALYWTSSAVFVWQSTKERSFYATTLVAGLAVILLSLRLLDRPSRRDAVLMGLAGGIGWHSSPNIVYLAAPALLWLVVESVRARRFEVLRLWWLGALGAVAGALPWIVSNVRTGGASIRLATSGTGTTYLERLGLFFREGFPYALGVQTPHEPIRWPSVLLYLVILAGLVAAFVRLPRRAWGIGLGAVAFPFIFAVFPTSWYVGEPRYLLFLWPLVILVAASGIAGIGREHLAVVLLAAVAAYTVAGSALMVQRGRESVIADFSPGDLGPVVRELQSKGIDRVFADYWIAYRLALATEEEIVAAPLDSRRYEPYEVEVRAVERPPYVLYRRSCLEDVLLTWLAEGGVDYRRTVAGRFSLIEPGERVLPEGGLSDRLSADEVSQGQICPEGVRPPR